MVRSWWWRTTVAARAGEAHQARGQSPSDNRRSLHRNGLPIDSAARGSAATPDHIDSPRGRQTTIDKDYGVAANRDGATNYARGSEPRELDRGTNPAHASNQLTQCMQRWCRVVVPPGSPACRNNQVSTQEANELSTPFLRQQMIEKSTR